jgi:hypothetical protein
MGALRLKEMEFVIAVWTSVATLKPAIHGHLKTGQRELGQDKDIYSAAEGIG